MNMNFFAVIFQGYCLLFRETYLNEHLYVAASFCSNRKTSQGRTYFLGKYNSREYFNLKIPHSKLLQGKYIFPGGSNYLLVNKHWGSCHFPVNIYWGVLFSGQWLHRYILKILEIFVNQRDQTILANFILVRLSF